MWMMIEAFLDTQALQLQQLLDHTAGMRRHQRLLEHGQVMDIADQLPAADLAFAGD